MAVFALRPRSCLPAPLRDAPHPPPGVAMSIAISTRMLAGLTMQAQVVLVAVPTRDLLIMHPPASVARLLAGHRGRQPERHDDG